jgi:hypothetical protein
MVDVVVADIPIKVSNTSMIKARIKTDPSSLFSQVFSFILLTSSD